MLRQAIYLLYLQGSVNITEIFSGLFSVQYSRERLLQDTGSPVAVAAEADLLPNIHSSLKFIHRVCVVIGLHFSRDLLLGIDFLYGLPFRLHLCGSTGTYN